MTRRKGQPAEEPDPRKLDPDEIACPRCHAKPGAVCHDPRGRKAKRIHAARREAAGGAPAKPSPASTADRAKGARAKNAKVAKDRATVAAVVGETRARALITAAEELGEEAVRWDRDRMTLKRLILDDALLVWATFGEAVEGYRRVRLDEAGVPMRIPREKVRRERVPTRYDETGTPGGFVIRETRDVVDELDVRGAFGPDDVKALAVAAGVALDKVRLEEGSSTSRNEHKIDGFGAPLADLSDAELRTFADKARAALDELTGEEP